MKKTVSLLLAVVMLFGSMLALTSCDPKDAGAEISIYLGKEVFDFDPSDYYAESNAAQVLSLLYEPLFRLNSKGKIECAAAEDYEIDKEKRTITIDLRETYWSDEIRVKAEDFVYAWRDIILEPNNANPAAALFYDIENALEVKNAEDSLFSLGVVATETYQLEITYREGADVDRLLKNLASVAASPLRQDVVSLNPMTWSKDVSTIVTNGPFRLDSLDHQLGEFTLSRNLGYHQVPTVKDYDNKVKPASLVTFTNASGEDFVLTYKDVESKTVFFLSEAPLDDRSANKNKAQVADELSTYTYVFNTTKAPFDNENVRKALSMVLDRNAIAEAVTFAKPANGFLPEAVAKSVYGKSVSDRISTSANLTEAQSLINAANLTASQKSFTITVADDDESVKIAELAAASWKQLGFTVKIEKVSSVVTSMPNTSGGDDIQVYDSAIQRLVKDASYGERNFDVLAVDWQLYSTDAFVALASLTSDMNGNGASFSSTGAATLHTSISGWVNEAFDGYVKAAFNAKTEAERQEALKNAEKTLLKSAPVIPVLYNMNFAFISDDLSKVTTDTFGNFVFDNAKLKDYRKYLAEK